MIKLLAFYLLLLVLFVCIISCNPKQSTGKLISKINIEILERQENKYYKTIFIIHTKIKNDTGKDIYFFNPKLWVVTEVPDKLDTVPIGMFRGKVDWLEFDSIAEIQDYEDDSTRTLLGKQLAKQVEFIYKNVKHELAYQIPIWNMYFLKKDQEVVIHDIACALFKSGPSRNCLVYTDNTSEREDSKGYQLFKDLPHNFKGYEFWQGDIEKDSIELILGSSAMHLPEVYIHSID